RMPSTCGTRSSTRISPAGSRPVRHRSSRTSPSPPTGTRSLAITLRAPMRTRDAEASTTVSRGSATTNTAMRSRPRSLSTAAQTAAATPAANRQRPRVVSPDSARRNAGFGRPAEVVMIVPGSASDVAARRPARTSRRGRGVLRPVTVTGDATAGHATAGSAGHGATLRYGQALQHRPHDVGGGAAGGLRLRGEHEPVRQHGNGHGAQAVGYDEA